MKTHTERPSGELYLQIGECGFGELNARLRTLVGSCVAITLWHPRRRLGAMCHIWLPERKIIPAKCDGRFGEEAMALLVAGVAQRGTRIADYEAGVYGGGSIMQPPRSGNRGGRTIGAQNIEKARELLQRHGLSIRGDCLGGAGYRDVCLDVASGRVEVRRVQYQQ